MRKTNNKNRDKSQKVRTKERTTETHKAQESRSLSPSWDSGANVIVRAWTAVGKPIASASALVMLSALFFMSCSSEGGNMPSDGTSATSVAPADPFEGYDQLIPIQQMPGVEEVDPPIEVPELREMLEDNTETIQPEQDYVVNTQPRSDVKFEAKRVHKSCSVRTYEAAPGYSEQFLMSPFTNFYPGAIYDGTTIANGGYRAIQDGARKPLVVTAVGINGLNGSASAVMENPSLGAYTDFLNDILSRSEEQNLEPIANSTYTEVTHYDTENFRNSLRIGLAADAGTVKVNLTSGFKKSRKSKTNRIFLRFNQVHFTASLSNATPGFENWYSTPPKLQSNVAPVYIDYIKYGRVFIVSLETTVNERQVKNYFNLNFSAPQSSVTVDQDNSYKNVIGSSQINVYVVGGDQTLCNSITDAESLRKCATQGGLNYINSAPIAYGLNYVPDGTAVKVLVNTQYKIRECEFQTFEETIRQRIHLAAIREVRPAPRVSSCPVYTELCHRTVFNERKCRQVVDQGWTGYCNTTFRRLTRPVELQGGLGLIQTPERPRGFALDSQNKLDAPCFATSGTQQERSVIFASGGKLGATQTLQVQPGLGSATNTWKVVSQTLDPQKELVYDLNSDKKYLKICSSIRPSIVGADSASYPTLTGSWVINPLDITETGKKIIFSDSAGRTTEYCLYSKIENTTLPEACGIRLQGR